MAIYLDDPQRKALARQAASWTWRTQWPTWLLIVVIYGGWFGVAIHARQLGLPLTAFLLAVLSAWYMSLQHELLHGHPTRSPFINALFGFAPLAVWFPYRVYRESHLQHHDAPHLTHPGLDPDDRFAHGLSRSRACGRKRGQNADAYAEQRGTLTQPCRGGTVCFHREGRRHDRER